LDGTVFHKALIAAFGKILINVSEWKSLDFNRKLEIVHLCDVSSMSETKV
jgi:hypothetical protein